ncbi:MAG: peptidylprolyl isomerase [Sphaerochaetaceae bacterium]|jgi:parvulin-like peptidyl-prolyl isomerase|nr:peptidylprolyl isomerase [Sphaerochaetaceae bacterium]MDD3942244.1 peptidylprolyl isomerase [Sphaerochaetaceae bacterium]MDX9938895.1 peptidylprolyl isomerase [Sphaerochaetaceae bacterium]
MRNKLILLLCIMLVLPLSTISANIISQPAATVNLIRNRVISVSELDARVAAYQAEAKAAGSAEIIRPVDVLNVMINDELVLQGAERDGFSITDAQVEQLVRQQKTYVEQQVGRAITDAQFETVIRNNYGISLVEFKKNIKESAVVDLYVRGKMSSVLQSYQEPTDEQVNEFFRVNRSAFMNPELVRISHIFMPFTDTDKAEVKRQMDQLARWIRYNTYTFEELVPKYSKDTDSVGRGGDIGWLAFDDEEMRAYLGPVFFDAVFALPLGKPSGVLESTGGYHIVKVTTHTEPKLLGIDDFINPDSNVTVRQYIRQTLTSRSQQAAYLKAIDSLVQQLRSEALVDILIAQERAQ